MNSNGNKPLSVTSDKIKQSILTPDSFLTGLRSQTDWWQTRKNLTEPSPLTTRSRHRDRDSESICVNQSVPRLRGRGHLNICLWMFVNVDSVCACQVCCVHVTLQRLHFHLSLSLVSLFLLLFCLFLHQVWPLAWATPINLLCILKKQKQQNASGKHINILIHHSASELQCQGMHTHTHTHTHSPTDRKFPRQHQSKCFISIYLPCKCVCVYLWTHAESKVCLETHLVSMKLCLTSECSTSYVFMCQSTKTQTDCTDKICHRWTRTNSAEKNSLDQPTVVRLFLLVL